MPGRALFIQHQDDCPPGYVGERVEQRGLQVEVVAAQASSLPDPTAFDLVVPLGSDDSAFDESVPYLQREFDLLSAAVAGQVPVFGICFGAQLLSRALGGSVRRLPEGPEIGWLDVDTTSPDLVERGPWLVWHLDVFDTPPGGRLLASTAAGPQAFSHGPHVGTQFHPEATLESATVWAEHYGGPLSELGIDPTELLAETSTRRDEARKRAYTLTDRVLDRAAVTARAD